MVMSAWTNTRDLPPAPKQTFREWWATEMSGAKQQILSRVREAIGKREPPVPLTRDLSPVRPRRPRPASLNACAITTPASTAARSHEIEATITEAWTRVTSPPADPAGLPEAWRRSVIP
jgi:hypothetical protein